MAESKKLIHTPEGVRDSYHAECRRKLAVQEKILNTFYLYGYEHIQTPALNILTFSMRTGEAYPPGRCLNFLTGTMIPWCCGRI